MDTSSPFQNGSKVVISPDKMRAWISLEPPTAGKAYTAEAVEKWLPENGVVYGVKPELVKRAIASHRYQELLEVAQGDTPVDASGASYTLRIEKKAFTGLNSNSDGSLFYDDLSFLQEAEEGQVLADIVPENPGKRGLTVTGEIVEPRPAAGSKVLTGSGYGLSKDGSQYFAPTLSHVSFVKDQLVVTPLLKLASLSSEDGPVEFDGNVLVEKDVQPNSVINATGSVYIAGRVVSASITAGRNILLCKGILGQSGFGKLEAKDNVWSAFFEGCNICAGGDICGNHLSGCEANAEGKISILGGRGAILNSTLYAKDGVIAQHIGSSSNDSTVINVGMEKELIDRYEGMERRLTKLNQDVQSLLHNISAFERVNRNKPNGGKNDPSYKDMVSRKNQSISVVNIITTERSRLKRAMAQYSNVSVVVRGNIYPGVVINIDTRSYSVSRQMQKVKFVRDGENIDPVLAGTR